MRAEREVEGLSGLADGPTWQRLLLPAMIAVIVAASTGTASFFGSKVVTGAETQAALSSQVSQLNKSMDGVSTKVDSIFDRISGLYTRAEAQNDRAETRSHFEALDRRVDELQRRIDLIQPAPSMNVPRR